MTLQLNSPEMIAFFQQLQKACLPAVWSRGVSSSRAGAVHLDQATGEEIVLRVSSDARAVSHKVSLWPGDEDYFCDCDEKSEPCSHVAAAVVALRGGLKAPEVGSDRAGASHAVQYRLYREGKRLCLERLIQGERLTQTLMSEVSGRDSGRIAKPKIVATQDDFAIDSLWGDPSVTRLDRERWSRISPRLKNISGWELDGIPLSIGGKLQPIGAVIRDDGDGFRLLAQEIAPVEEIFEGGLALSARKMVILDDPGLTPEERKLIDPPGRRWSGPEVVALVSDILPKLQAKISVEIQTRRLPNVTHDLPRVVLRTDRMDSDRLSVVAAIEYPSPYSARNEAEERKLAIDLRERLQLSIGNRAIFSGLEAVDFLSRSEGWDFDGSGHAAFNPVSDLAAQFSFSEQGSFGLVFKTGSGREASMTAAFEAWRENASFVRLLDGGFAEVPRDWFEKYGARIERLFALKDGQPDGVNSPVLRPEAVAIATELGVELPERWAAFRDRIQDFTTLPNARLPSDLQAELRPYQRQGVNWLHFLRESDLGALLADDMGLGKTLQAIASIRGRALIVCPTSVLSSWQEQLARFRPKLTVGFYYGADRRLRLDCDVTLTSYGILRSDREILTEPVWDTAIIDEAQILKNPDSQIAQAAHSLKARFRIALSGTPIENRMTDLWSQFQFVNPGLLGTRAEFEREVSLRIQEGDAHALERLRKRIQPFILRRMKRDVAPELPPKTEVTLQCDLSQSERDLYQTLLASSRREVVEKLEQGGSVFSALELLLRLRQACCHSALIPGEQAKTSSKLDLLTESLSASIELGHRSLVFSQWTSFLDLIGERLTQEGIRYVRLDGSTTDRARVVEEFQRADGPPVFLISLKAGGVGLTLTAADHVYIMDSWWNPAVEEQAIDRAHRIGQENPVLVHRLITRDTLEEKIVALQDSKRELAHQALEGGDRAVTLTRDDLLSLLG